MSAPRGRRTPKGDTAAWVNRIISYGEEAPEQLLASPRNFRIHPQPQQDALTGSLNELGWIQDIIVSKRTGHVIDGHLRVSLAMSRGELTVPVKYVDLSEAEEHLALLALDPMSALAVTDKEMLDELLRDVSPGNAALQQFLTDFAAKEGITPPAVEPAYTTRFELVVECQSEGDLEALYDQLTGEGRKCRVLTL